MPAEGQLVGGIDTGDAQELHMVPYLPALHNDEKQMQWNSLEIMLEKVGDLGEEVPMVEVLKLENTRMLQAVLALK